MPAFRFAAVKATGEMHTGVMEAGDAGAVVQRLQREGYIPLRAEPEGRFGGFRDLFQMDLGGSRGLSRAHIAVVTHELATMLEAGENMDRALRFVCETAPTRRVARIMEAVRTKVRGGSPLADALASPPAKFPRLYIGMIRAGESSGSLGETLDRLSELMEREIALAMTVNSALIYPALLFLVAVGTITMLVGYVLPQFVPLFEQNGVQMPFATRMLIAFGAFVTSAGPWILAVALVLTLVLRRAFQDPNFRRPWDRFRLRIPILGPLAREIVAARFCRTLGTLLTNGTPLIAALGIVKDTLGNLAAVEALEKATESARSGAGLARPLAAAGIFPTRTMHLLRLGEETGQLGRIALKAAGAHEAHTREMVQRLVALLVPVITISMGAAVAAIIGSLLVAMLSLNDIVG